MTDLVRGDGGGGSAPSPAGGKRERLIGGALQALHAQGVEGTTLADIAHAADVPVGNVYYYFKTKDELVQAVIGAHADEVKSRLAALEHHRTPKARLKAFVRMLTEERELAARYGCPQGSLCSELDKRADRPGVAAAELMRVPIEWAEGQFRLLGRRDAHDLAVHLLAVYEGSALLANTLREPDILSRQARRLDRWIDAL